MDNNAVQKEAQPSKINGLKGKLKNTYDSFHKFLTDSVKGRLLTSILLSVWVMAGLVKYLYPVFPWVICILLAFLLVSIVDEILYLITRILFHNKNRGVIYGFTEFLFLLAGMLIAYQVRHIVSGILFSFVVSLCSNLFGRFAWLLLVEKRYTVVAWVTLAASFLVLFTAGILLHIEGFENRCLKEYLTEGRERASGTDKAYSADTPSPVPGFPAGRLEAAWITYGTGEEGSMESDTADISWLASRSFFTGGTMNRYFGYDLSRVPMSGKIWYPKEAENCPVLFLIHGNHAYPTQSYLGYDYLGQYLASHGYVVVSVDESSCNDLSNENDARAVLLLENIKRVLKYNKDPQNPLYHKIDEDKIALGGHSRGGEAAALAYLFNGYDSYPDNGAIAFDYGFSIKAVAAIAPTVDQYMPAGRQVVLQDVNYLLLQGANDHDITSAMGEKQYMNISYTGKEKYIKSMLYIAGANHGQFNSEWGKYDLVYPLNCYLNVAELMPQEEQQEIAKIFIKVFLDVTLSGDTSNEQLLKDYRAYEAYLPETIYQQMYQTSDFQCLSNFEEDSNLNTASMEGAELHVWNINSWRERRRSLGNGTEGENYVLELVWRNTKEAELSCSLPAFDMKNKKLVFDLADMSENKAQVKEPVFLGGRVVLTDTEGATASADFGQNTLLYPSLPVRLGKIDGLFGNIDWKHSFQTVTLSPELFQRSAAFDDSEVSRIEIIFDYSENGRIQLDNLGFLEQ